MASTNHKDESTTERKSFVSNIVSGILIAGCCWSLGYGYSQSTLSASVARVSVSLDHVREVQAADKKASEEADQRLTHEIAIIRDESKERMKAVMDLMQRVSDQNQEMVSFLKSHTQKP